MSKLSLIYHGWGYHTTKVRILSEWLSKNDYDTLIPRYLESSRPFSIKNVLAETKKKLKKREPKIIAGISLGGMILPHIAQNFPQAKLIFIATGHYFKPKSAALEFLMTIIKTRIGAALFRLIPHIPKKLIIPAYKAFYPFKGNKGLIKEYKSEIQTNVEYLLTLPYQKYVEVIEFGRTTNNASILKRLKNEALIFSGYQDALMPLGVGKKLEKLLTNSQLIVNEGSHFNAFTKESLPHLDNFL